MTIKAKVQIAKYNKDNYIQEKEKLKDADPFVVVEYIKSSFEMIMSMKLDNCNNSKCSAKEFSNSRRNDPISVEALADYEEMLQKLEAEARNHIRVEQQLKLQIETIQFKSEEIKQSLEEKMEEVKHLNEV